MTSGLHRVGSLLSISTAIALLTACGGGDDAGTTASPSTASANRLPAGSASADIAYGSIPIVGTGAAAQLPGGPQAWYLSPIGNDSADCRSAATACKSFASVFGRMPAGGELVLLDGTYSAAAGTGTMHWDNGAASAQPPSGSAASATYVHALNPGKVIIQGPLFIGRSFRKDSYITLRGLRFEGGGDLYNTSHVTIKDTGFHGAFGIGTIDHDNGNTDNLVEDVWVWASRERGIAMNYRAHRNVWRRVIVRGDGCGTEDCAGSGNPNIGFTVYDSHDVSVQNVIVVDRVLAPSDSPYADFAVASHTGAPYEFGHAEWLGTISLNAPDIGYYMEPDEDTTVAPTIKLSNAVAWNAAGGGFNLARTGSGIVMENLLAHSRSDDALRVAPELEGTGSLRNAVVLGSGRFGLNSAYTASYVSVNGNFSEGLYNQTTPTHVIPGDPLANGSLKYITRIEAGSALKGQGAGGADVGANVRYRYGRDGTHFGDPGYNTLTSTPLWPWPNQARIKAEMCRNTTRGFCSTGKRLDGVNPVTLTSYIWEAAGNPMPQGF